MTWDYVSEILALAQDDNAQWTIRRAYQTLGRTTRARTTTWTRSARSSAGAVQQNTVFAGGYGVALSLSRDVTESANVIMGEGVHPVDNSDLSGGRWREQGHAVAVAVHAVVPVARVGVDVPDYAGDTNGDFTTDVISALTGVLRAASAPSVTIGTVLTVGTAAISALKEDTGWRTRTATSAAPRRAWLFGASALYPALTSVRLVQAARLRFPGRAVRLHTGWRHSGRQRRVRPDRPVVERVIGYGEGIAKADARKNARSRSSAARSRHRGSGPSPTLDPTDETSRPGSTSAKVAGSGSTA